MQHFHSRRFPSRFPRCATENRVDRASVGAGRKEGWGGGYRRTGSSSGSTAQPTNSKRGGETRGGGEGRGRQRSRANPFKSTQLRQWGFICYLGGHIVSRRERTDRLRRASDGLAPGEPVPTRNLAPGERLLSGPLLFILRPFLPLLATLPRGPTPLVFAHYRYQNRQRRRHPPEKRIRRYTSLLEIFLPWLLCIFTWEMFSRVEWILRLPQVDFTEFQWGWLLVCFSGFVSFWDGMWWKNIW